jgi:RNA polymerase sigma-70 factor, ECF subfamily
MNENKHQSIELFDALVKPIEGQMIAAVWRVLRHEHDFDDAFQRALSNIWHHLDTIREHQRPTACILRICLNAAHDILRKRCQRERHETENTLSEEFIDTKRDGAEQLIGEEQENEILTAIASLPSTQAEAVLLRYTEDLTYREISQALECSEASARQAVCRGRDKLTSLLLHLRPLTPIERIS